MTVRRASDHFRCGAGRFKFRAPKTETNVRNQLRTEAEDLVGVLLAGIRPDELSYASVPTRLNLPHRGRFVPIIGPLWTVHGFGRSARHRRTDEQTTQMHDDTTTASEILDELEAQRFDSGVNSFDSVLLRAVKSKSPHGEGIYSDLTDLTYSLRGYTRAPVWPPACSPMPNPPSERIGKIGKIGPRPRAVMRFSVNRRRLNAVERRLISGKIAGWSA